MAKERQYTPFIYLATDIKQGASDMIEAIGSLSVLKHVESHSNAKSLERMEMRDLRNAIDKVVKALRNYDALVSAEIELATREQYEDAAEVL